MSGLLVAPWSLLLSLVFFWNLREHVGGELLRVQKNVLNDLVFNLAI
jgi:hypothetical protein